MVKDDQDEIFDSVENSPEIIRLTKDENLKTQEQTEQFTEISWSNALPQLSAVCMINFLVIQAGINMAFSSILIPQLLANDEIVINKNSASWIASIVTISLPLGSLACGFLMDRFGRRKLAMFMSLPFTLAWILIVFSSNIYMIYAARIISGISGGKETI